MAFTPSNYQQQQQREMVTPKEREALGKRRDQYLAEINERLNRMPDSEMKQELMKKRDHCFLKFPVFPRDMSIWIVAYYEDWLKEYESL